MTLRPFSMPNAVFALLLLSLAACQPPSGTAPTVAPIPTATWTAGPTITPALPPTSVPTETPTPTSTPVVVKEWQYEAIKPGEWGLLRDENGNDLLTMESEAAAEKLRDDMIRTVLSFNTHYVAKAREKGVPGYGNTEAAKWLEKADWDPDKALELWMVYAKDAQSRGEKIEMNLPERAMDMLIKSEGIDGKPPIDGAKLSDEVYKVDLRSIGLSLITTDKAKGIFQPIKLGQLPKDGLVNSTMSVASTENGVALAAGVIVSDDGVLQFYAYNQNFINGFNLRMESSQSLGSMDGKNLEEMVNDIVQAMKATIGIDNTFEPSKATLANGEKVLIVYPSSELYKSSIYDGSIGIIMNK